MGRVHVQTGLLFEGVGHAEDAVVEMRRPYAEVRGIQHHACKRLRVARLAHEAGRCAERGATDGFGRHFGHVERKGIAVHQVPGIATQLALHAVQNAGRAMNPQHPTAAEKHAQQPVEPDEVIHVAVRDEHVAHAQQVPGR